MRFSICMSLLAIDGGNTVRELVDTFSALWLTISVCGGCDWPAGQTSNRQVLLQAAEAELKSNADLLKLSVRICGCTSSCSCAFVDTPCYSISAATAAVGCQSLSCGMHYAC
jgi:sulfite reductase beta subunit-like hemoprotein